MSNVKVTTFSPMDNFKRELELAWPTIAKLVPANILPDKFKAMMIMAVSNNPKLMECTPMSLTRATTDAAELGLSLNPNLKECDILPVWGPKGSVAQCRPRAGGLMKLARQTGEIADIYAHEVYENDTFEVEYGLEKKLIHKPASGDRGNITYGYVVWVSKDGNKGFEVVDKKRIDRAKGASEGYKAFKAGNIKSTPWVTDEGEMVRKTAVRAGSKYMPMSSESDAFRRAMQIENEIDGEAHETHVITLASSNPEPRPSSTAQVRSLEAKLVSKEPAAKEPAAKETVVEDTDWESVAKKLRKDLSQFDSSLETMNQWLEETADVRATIKDNAPEWHAKLDKVISDRLTSFSV
ncbi:RecT Recombinational DNA repair protein (RecE pathway) [uncultured Caudovirales phage]|uniref:RecT Recombinational DNA repair protein (RecE pathway) n=1 Tax=uncultured Caudovirales phage TaxID=2100421 RepID=A0A6J5NGN2_9CAUD|nr:RecT Recombinational DNA repair protein (RecE pathway) [uncultured Caudovirales phage]CAB4168706.1 RecT Recombinational DNA repair protein (RecE pathway) [uncultured Caudovirales phage]CAB4181759.1 RecT Recombinational DNA repair protein (RecE pathway) [uncultured Caudovirales phage]CAB4195301.1 RecT Recombinational DNA repair protein (RecE pathway) [uncultured Caudovirales phage]CAB4210720.1 RecT Recombinational DNA repair protein (RecE pathway) [uncultured Caudovirales phage]